MMQASQESIDQLEFIDEQVLTNPVDTLTQGQFQQ